MSSTTNWKYILLLFVPGTLWGSSFLLNVFTLDTIPPFTLTAGRNLLSILPLIILLYWIGGRLFWNWASWKSYLIVGFFNNSFPFFLVAWGQQYIDSGLAAILLATMPLFTIFLAHFITTDEKLTLEKLSGISLGLIGIVVLIGPEALQGLGFEIWGQLALLGASMSYAIGGIWVRNIFREAQRKNQSSSQWTPLIEITTGQFIASTIFVIPGSVWFEQPWTLQPSTASILALVAQAWLVSIIAVLIYYYIIDTAGATIASTVIYLIPINGVFWGVLILGEPLTWQAIVSLGLILLGIAIINGLLRQRRAVVAEV